MVGVVGSNPIEPTSFITTNLYRLLFIILSGRLKRLVIGFGALDDQYYFA